jgi:hypothetical protein
VHAETQAEGAYRGRATARFAQAGSPVKLSFIDQARRSGSVRYRVCVIEYRRTCYARTFQATPNFDWDTFTVKVTQGTRPMIVLWYVANRLVWASTVLVHGE